MQVLIYGVLSLLFSFVFLLSSPLVGHAFRCGSGLVSVGDSKGKVLIECGKPTFKEKVAERESRSTSAGKSAKKKSGKTTKTVEQWTYNCGKNDFIYVLTFEGGKLVREETDGRGRGESECQGR
ncbi:MAG: DUF2845 domain-containing protein [Pseudomonadota bacterium]|nr:DUF2845 domain-containing protein [Pseudomonadota bacterium]